MGRGTSVARMLRVAFAVPIACILLAGLAGVAGLWHADRAAGELAGRLPALRDHNAGALQALVDAETGARGLLLTGDEAFLAPYERGMSSFPGEIERARALAGDDAELLATLDEESAAGHRWLDEFAVPLVDLARRDPEAARARVASGVGKQLLDRYRGANAETSAVLDVRTADVDRAIGRTFTLSAGGIAALALVTAAAGWRAATRATRRVIDPLDVLRATVGRLADGDLTARVVEEGPTEIREVLTSVNDLGSQLDLLQRLQRERLDRERLLNRVARAVRTDLDPASVLRRAVEEIGPALGVDRVVVRLADEAGVGPAKAVWLAPGVDPLTDEQAARLTGGLDEFARGALDRCENVVIDDVSGVEDLVPAGLAGDVRALLVVPLSAGHEAVGLLLLHDVTGPRAWSWQLSLVEALARDLTAALAHAFAYERLRELDREKGTFVSSVSHELRTPLTSIVGYVEMLVDGDAGPLAPEQRQLLGVVERSTDRLLTLIDDLLTLSRIESGTLRPTFASVDLAAVVTGALETFRPLLADRDIELDVRCEPGLAPVWVDARHVERVLFNLVSNAVKFSPDGAVVTVETGGGDGGAVLTVADRGYGIPFDEQDKLFTRFFRSTTSSSLAIQGTGLGLVIVRNIVDQHGGSITVDSAPGEGTTVRVTLPSAAAVPMGARHPLAEGV